MNRAMTAVAAIVLAVAIIVALYASSSNVLEKGKGEITDRSSNDNELLECVTNNPTRGRSWCKDQLSDWEGELETVEVERVDI